MLIKDQQAAVRLIESSEDFDEARLEAVGFLFHGRLPGPDGKVPRARATTNLLHFSRCPRLDRAPDSEGKIWYRSIRVAKADLDERLGDGRWRWCKTCERQVTQRILNEP